MRRKKSQPVIQSLDLAPLYNDGQISKKDQIVQVDFQIQDLISISTNHIEQK